MCVIRLSVCINCLDINLSPNLPDADLVMMMYHLKLDCYFQEILVRMTSLRLNYHYHFHLLQSAREKITLQVMENHKKSYPDKRMMFM